MDSAAVTRDKKDKEIAALKARLHSQAQLIAQMSAALTKAELTKEGLIVILVEAAKLLAPLDRVPPPPPPV